jgi:RNA polymerase sigma-70 factor (ECF subfamily)
MVRREKVVALQTMADIDFLGVAADQPTPEQQLVDRDELQRAGEAIAGLPPRVGEVFRLRRVHGLSQKQVAHKLGLAESTVEKHMHRGLVLLLERFASGGYPASQVSSVGEEVMKPSYGQAQRKRDR